MFLIFQYEDLRQSNQMGWFLVIVLSVVLVIVIVVFAYILNSKARQIEYLKTLVPSPEQQKPEKTPLEKGICPSCGTKLLDKTGDFCSKCGASLK